MEYLMRELVMDTAATGGLFRAEECGSCTDTQTDCGSCTDTQTDCGSCTDTQTDCGSCTDTQTDCGSCTDGATDAGSNFSRVAKSRTTCAGLSRFDDLERELERALSRDRSR
jgi:hypothetical protein